MTQVKFIVYSIILRKNSHFAAQHLERVTRLVIDLSLYVVLLLV